MLIPNPRDHSPSEPPHNGASDGQVEAIGREATGRRKDGALFPLDIVIGQLPSGGAEQGFVATVRDIRERRRLEDQLRQAQKMEAIGQLTGGIAHDFNNILTVIIGTAEILTTSLTDRPPLLGVARMIDEAASRGADLTQRLLAFARKQPLAPRETDINALITDTSKLLAATLGEQIEIKSIQTDELPHAFIDASQLATALINLALNSRDAMPTGGKLTIEPKQVFLDQDYANQHTEVRANHYIMIAVSDTGSGIPAEILSKVFEPFFTTKEVGRGTGLGLSMVFGFVKQSHGHIEIYSEEGFGTTIKLYIPQMESGSVPAPPDTAIKLLIGGHETILVVEDDALVRTFVVDQVQSLGYSVLSASSAAEALAIIDRGEPFDLLFSDVIMPGGMNGRELSAEAMRRRPGLKVLFTSGYTEDAIIHHGRLDSGVSLLAKPYRKSELAEMLRRAVGHV